MSSTTSAGRESGHRWLLSALAFLAFALSCAAYALATRRIPTDYVVHAQDVRRFLDTALLPPHFLYFLVLAGGSLLTSGSTAAVLGLTVVVLSAAVAGKFLASAWVAVRELQPAGVPGGRPAFRFPALLAVGLFLLLFAHCLPRTPLYFAAAGQPLPHAFSAYCFYAGRATPTVWHNSTTVFTMPLVVLLCYESSLLLTRPGAASAGRLLGLVALNVAAKPSFVLALAPVLPPLVFVRHRFGRPFRLACTAVVLGGLFLACQLWWLGVSRSSSYGVSLDFLKVWGPHAAVLPLDLLGSFAYPLLFAILYPRLAGADWRYLYAAALAASACLIGMTLCEAPPLTDCGNFMWQVHMCCYVWFFATLLCHARDLLTSGRRLAWRDTLLFACLSLHVLNGVVYLVRSLATRTFM